MKQTILCVLIASSVHCFSQADSLPDPEVYFFAVLVKDIDRSISWYSKMLGFQVVDQLASEERGFKQANLKRAGVALELIESKSLIFPEDILGSYSRETRIAGFFKFGLKISDFDNWIIFLTQSHVEFSGNVVTDRLSGKKMVIIKDPDGNRIQLFEN